MKKLLLAALAIALTPTIASAFEPIYLSEDFEVSVDLPLCVETSSGAVLFVVGTDDILRVLYPDEPCPETTSTSD